MNEVVIIGYKQLNYTKKNGNVVDGVIFYVTFESADSKVNGVCVKEFFLSSKYITGTVSVGSVASLQYSFGYNGEPKLSGIIIL